MFSYHIKAAPEEFDLPLCVTSGQVFRWEPLSELEWFGVDGDHWYQVRQTAPDTYEIESNVEAEHFRRLFRLDEDYRAMLDEVVRRGPELKPYIEALPGLRVMRPTSASETLFCFLCTSNNHLSRITGMVRKLAEYGELISAGSMGGMGAVDEEATGMEDDAQRPWTAVARYRLKRSPSAERIAQIPEADLRRTGFGYRGRTIPIAAAQIAAKPADWLDSLRNRPYEEVHNELLGLEGVGPKLADCVALYALWKLEAVPIDTHLWQAICRIYFPEWKEKSLTHARYKLAGDFMRERFGDLAGVAHQFLYFENLRNWRKR